MYLCRVWLVCVLIRVMTWMSLDRLGWRSKGYGVGCLFWAWVILHEVSEGTVSVVVVGHSGVEKARNSQSWWSWGDWSWVWLSESWSSF